MSQRVAEEARFFYPKSDPQANACVARNPSFDLRIPTT
jgi:hypothetical protein